MRLEELFVWDCTFRKWEIQRRVRNFSCLLEFITLRAPRIGTQNIFNRVWSKSGFSCVARYNIWQSKYLLVGFDIGWYTLWHQISGGRGMGMWRNGDFIVLFIVGMFIWFWVCNKICFDGYLMSDWEGLLTRNLFTSARHRSHCRSRSRAGIVGVKLRWCGLAILRNIVIVESQR